MIAKKANCDLRSPHSTLTDTDILILNKIYCKDKPVVQENVVTSPNYPATYPENQNKETRLEVATGSVIVLKFTHFSLEDEGCKYDWVQVVDGDGSVLMDKKCGSTVPGPVTSKTHVMIVKFVSDGSVNKPGFRAEWTKSTASPVAGGWGTWSGYGTCTNNKDGKSDCKKRRVRYCNNPPPSNGGAACVGSGDEQVVCTSTELTPASSHPNCMRNGGWSIWSAFTTCTSECKHTRTRTCTNPAPINDKDCPGTNSETSACTGGDCASTTGGTIKSTNYPENYNNNENREIPIEVSIGSKIKLDFTAFDVEYEANCGYDWVQVKDTDGSPLGNTASKKFCGTTIPPSLTSTGNKMTVVFRSDYDVVKKGFEATWEKVTGTVATSGVVTSSNYPNNYPHNQDNVRTTLTVADGKKVQLTITDLNIEAGEGCPYDHLTVYDGTTLLKKICGTTLPGTPLVSTSNVMTLSFKSDHSVNQKGFSAKWEQID